MWSALVINFCTHCSNIERNLSYFCSVMDFAKGAFRNISYLLLRSREYAKEIEHAILVLSDNFFSGLHPVSGVVRTAWVR